MYDAKQQLMESIRWLMSSDQMRSPQMRNWEAQTLIGRYIETTGQRPPADALTLLADYIMRDYISDRYKRTSQTEYPWLTDTQLERRTDVESQFVEHT